MKKIFRRKTVFIVAILLSALVVCVWLVLHKPRPDEKDNIRKETRILTESFPTKMLVLGDKFPVLPEGVNVEYVDHITVELTETTGTKYTYVMLIINDLSGEVCLTDEDFETIQQILNQKHVFFTYIGESNLAKFEEKGFHQFACPINDDGNRSFTCFDGVELMGVYSSDYDEVRDGGLSDGSLFVGIESAMVYMLEDREQEIGGGIR